MKRARILATTLTVCLLLLTMLAGCATPTATTAPTPTTAATAAPTMAAPELKVVETAGTLKIFPRMDQGWGALNAIAAQQAGDPYWEYVHKYFPNVTFQIVANGNYQAAIAAGDAPDIFFVEGDKATVRDLVIKQYAEPLDTYMANDAGYVDNFIPAIMDLMKVDGKTYAIPFSVMPQVLALNLDAFDKSNVAYPSLTWTVDEFVEACNKLTNKSDPTSMRVAIARNIEEEDYVRLSNMFLFAYDVKGYKEIGGKKLSNLSEDPNAITALEKYLEVKATNYACTMSKEDRNTMGLDSTIWNIDWTSGVAAMFPGVSAWAYEVNPTTKTVPFKQTFYPPFVGPTGASGCEQSFIMYAMSAAGKNKELAWQFLNFMTSELSRQSAYAPNPDDATKTIYPLRMDENTYMFMAYGIPPFSTEYKLSGDFKSAYEGLKAAAQNPGSFPVNPPKMVEIMRAVASGSKQLVDALKEYDDFVNANNLIDWTAYS